MVEFRPLSLFVAAVILSACATVGVAGAGTSAGNVFRTQNSALGEILVSAAGRTLYHSSAEQRNRVECTGSCAVKWPPLVISAHAKPIAGPGVTASLLGIVKRPDGRLQVTYHGMALYLFSGDRKAGDVAGQGAGQVWHAVTPAGAVVTKAATSNAGTSPTSSAGSGSSMGSGSSTGVNAGMWCAANPKSCVNGVPVGGGGP
jgi:predicted lipoprotein with Yx(FWY)xxD motif